MSYESIELVYGSGNVYWDFGHPDADLLQMEPILAVEIINMLDRGKLTVRGDHARTRIAAADFSRISNADLGRFMVDQLMLILNRLGARIEVRIKVRRVAAKESGVA